MVASSGFGQYQAGENHLALVARQYRGDGTKRGVLFLHGRGGGYLDAMTPGIGGEVCARLVNAGYPLLSCDLGGTVTWGNDTAQARVTTALGYLRSQFGASSSSVYVVGASMGALLALNWTKANLASVKALALCVPITDLADVHTNNRGGFATEAETAYGGAPAYATAEAAHNPAASPASFTSKPIRLWYASNDTTAVPATVTTFAASSGATTVNMGAVGHNVAWNPLDVLTWLEST